MYIFVVYVESVQYSVLEPVLHLENTPIRLWTLKRLIPEGLNLRMNLRA